MLSFVLWAVLFIAALIGAGYSHYRYRVIHNQYYEHLFAKNREETFGLGLGPERSRTVPVLVLAIVCVMVPMALAI